jgi:hypothetical protein
LCSSDAGNGSHGRGSSSAEGLSGAAVRGYGVLDGRLLKGVRAVVVADENVTVDVAEADEVVGVLVASIDAALVALDASVDNVLRIALVLRSDEAGSSGEGNGYSGDETHLDVWVWRGGKVVRVSKTVLKLQRVLRCKTKMPKANDGTNCSLYSTERER